MNTRVPTPAVGRICFATAPTPGDEQQREDRREQQLAANAEISQGGTITNVKMASNSSSTVRLRSVDQKRLRNSIDGSRKGNQRRFGFVRFGRPGQRLGRGHPAATHCLVDVDQRAENRGAVCASVSSAGKSCCSA